jgi:hypothetical protein
MKIEQLLVQHFYNNREVTLQGMGTFTLSADLVMPKENDKDIDIPDNAISFQYNPRATEDESLIDYIVQQTRKMKSLAAADLDSYLALGKQFLNIGKPFKIEGLGMLVKNQQGDLEFHKGITFQLKMETTPAALKEKKISADISFASESKTEGSGKKGLLITLLVIILALIGTAAWYFFIKKDNINSGNKPAETVQTDTLKKNTIPKDTVVNTPVPVTVTDGYTFKVVIMETADSAAAVARMNFLTARQHKIIMYASDSAKYRLAEPFTLPLADTARIKDSLNRFYYRGKAFIQLK